jgi:hypothetical protein
MAFKQWTRIHPFSPPHTLPVSLGKFPLRLSCCRGCTFDSRHPRSVLVWMFGNSGRGNAGLLSTPRIYRDASLVSGRGFLKPAEAHRRSRNVFGLHLRWKRGILSLSGVGPCFSLPEEGYLIILIQHSPVCPATSVVDIFKDPDAPPALVSHRLILLSLSHTWTRGRVVTPAGSLFRRTLQRFRFVATPRCVKPLP